MEVINDLEEEVLLALRRITQAIDVHSRYLTSAYGLTGPQLVSLRTLGRFGPMSPSELARQVALSQATMTGIIDRLDARGLVTRERTNLDRRLVTLRITDDGRELLARSPSALQHKLAEGLAALSPEEQQSIRTALAKIVSMMALVVPMSAPADDHSPGASGRGADVVLDIDARQRPKS